MGRPVRWGLLASLAFALLGAYHFLYQSAEPSLAQRSANAAAPIEKITLVEAAHVSVDTVLDIIHAVATLQPNRAVVVSPELLGASRVCPSPGRQGRNRRSPGRTQDSSCRAELGRRSPNWSSPRQTETDHDPPAKQGNLAHSASVMGGRCLPVCACKCCPRWARLESRRRCGAFCRA